jgi:hypothetical protein
MNCGIAIAKTHTYPNDKYDFPVWLRGRKTGKIDFDIKDVIVKKLSKKIHLSNKKNKEDVFSYFVHIFKNNTSFAINMKKNLDLTENEVEFLLGTTHSSKLKQIMSSCENKKLDIPEEKKEEKPDNIQQSLFDF